MISRSPRQARRAAAPFSDISPDPRAARSRRWKNAHRWRCCRSRCTGWAGCPTLPAGLVDTARTFVVQVRLGELHAMQLGLQHGSNHGSSSSCGAAFYPHAKRLVRHLDLARRRHRRDAHRAGSRLRVLQSERQPDLGPWHTWAPREPDAAKSPGSTGRPGWRGKTSSTAKSTPTCARRSRPSERVRAESLLRRQPALPRRTSRTTGIAPTNCCQPDSPAGAVVLLHGLSDSPYSLRHVARDLRGSRIRRRRNPPARPWHGARRASPRRAGRTGVPRRAWRCAKRADSPAPASPLHIVGYSNGGALAMQYTLDALSESEARPAGARGAVLADDRADALRALRGRGRLAGAAAAIFEVRLAGHRSRVQSLQVQLVSGQRGAPVL